MRLEILGKRLSEGYRRPRFQINFDVLRGGQNGDVLDKFPAVIIVTLAPDRSVLIPYCNNGRQ